MEGAHSILSFQPIHMSIKTLRIVTSRNRLFIRMFLCRKITTQSRWPKQKTETEKDTEFNMETRTGKKPRGVHKLQKIAIMEEYNEKFACSNLEVSFVNRRLWSNTHSHSPSLYLIQLQATTCSFYLTIRLIIIKLKFALVAFILIQLYGYLHHSPHGAHI